ncbi:MAG TPA: hypothetical protein VF411_01625 [Bacteroidia bacterium]
MKNNTKTITENEALTLLSIELPQLGVEIKNICKQITIFNVMSCFADVTKQMVKMGNLKEVKRCFNLAEKIWKKGNNAVKNVIENGYLFSLSTVLDLNTKIKDLLNATLKKEYYRQVYGHGI